LMQDWKTVLRWKPTPPPPPTPETSTLTVVAVLTTCIVLIFVLLDGFRERATSGTKGEDATNGGPAVGAPATATATSSAPSASLSHGRSAPSASLSHDRSVPASSLSHDRVAEEPLTATQRATWEQLAATEFGQSFARDDVLRALLTKSFQQRDAIKLLQRMAAWREKYRPELITPADLQNSLPSRCWQPGGTSKHGWPILEVYVARWRPFDYDNEEQHRLIGFFFSLVLQRNPSAERFALLFDMAGWTLSLGLPAPLRKVFTMIELAQNEFCERLGAVLLINVPPIFRVTWAIIEPLVHKRVAPRVQLFGANWRPSVLKLIDLEELPTTVGGMREETPVV